MSCPPRPTLKRMANPSPEILPLFPDLTLMKPATIFSLATTTTCLLWVAPVLSVDMTIPETPQAPQEIQFPPLGDLDIPQPEPIELENGLRIFLLPDKELPLIELRAVAGMGYALDPENKIGLARLTANTLRSGGTDELTGDAFDEFLENMAAQLDFSVETTTTSIGASSLAEDFPEMLRVLADLLQQGAFPEDKIGLEKNKIASEIARRNDEPFSIAVREYRKAVYGQDSPYASYPEYETVLAITRDDLIAQQRRYLRPDNMVLGISGDFDSAELKPMLEELFSGWKKPDEPLAKMPPVEEEYEEGFYLATKSDINQSTILMGHIGGKRDSPDFFALQVLNRILSDGFTSRLFANVRSSKGLAYSVFGQYAARYDYPGAFYAGCSTQTERTAEAIEAILVEIRKLQEEPVGTEELEHAKESYLNSFVFNFDDNSQIIERLITLEYHDYPLDFLQITKDRIEEVTSDDVLRVAQEHLHPDKLAIVVVGNLEPSSEILAEFGQIKAVDLTIPEPAATPVD